MSDTRLERLADAAGIFNPQQGPLSLIGGETAILGTLLVWVPATSLLLIRALPLRPK